VHETHEKNANSYEPHLGLLTARIKIPLAGEIRAYYLLLFSLFILFLITKNAAVGLLAGITILFIVLWESGSSIISNYRQNSHEKKEIDADLLAKAVFYELKDVFIAIFIGVVVWFGSGYLLNTPTPINAIVSCSMLPAYERGDMIILQGADVNTQYLQYSGKLADIAQTAQIAYQNSTFEVQGSIYSYCMQNRDERCNNFWISPQEFKESHGPLEFEYSLCKKYYYKENRIELRPCITKTIFEGEEILFDENADLLVYRPGENDIYALTGDIVHRARFAVEAGDGQAYFMKGDNNAVYDFQFYSQAHGKGNLPVREGQLLGKSVLRMPFIGNFKLFIAPQVLVLPDESTGCNAYFVK